MGSMNERVPAANSWLLVTHGRSASNLLGQLLFENKSNIQYTYYAFLEAMLADNSYKSKPLSELDEEQRATFLSMVSNGREKIKQTFANAHNAGKIGCHKEHAIAMIPATVYHENLRMMNELWASQDLSTPISGLLHQPVPHNPTCLDDAFLKSVNPIFLIRHPALTVPSMWRVLGQPDKMQGCTLRHSRDLFDYYKYHHERDSTWPSPILIESSDIANNFPMIQKLAATIGIDPQTVPQTWGQLSKEEYDAWPQVRKVMCATLATSTGIESRKMPASVKIDEEVKAWRTEFGDDVAGRLELYARRELPDYLYLLQYKLT